MHTPKATHTSYCHIDSPVGRLLLAAQGPALTDVHIIDGKYVPAIQADWQCQPEHPVLQATASQLDAYFAGQRQQFDLSLAPRGTAFQQRAWQALLCIPYGCTWTYGQQAAFMQQAQASRAVGSANGKNPLSIIIPCHRVVGANGAMTGYAGGVAHKIFLLQHEGALSGHLGF